MQCPSMKENEASSTSFKYQTVKVLMITVWLVLFFFENVCVCVSVCHHGKIWSWWQLQQKMPQRRLQVLLQVLICVFVCVVIYFQHALSDLWVTRCLWGWLSYWPQNSYLTMSDNNGGSGNVSIFELQLWTTLRLQDVNVRVLRRATGQWRWLKVWVIIFILRVADRVWVGTIYFSGPGGTGRCTAASPLKVFVLKFLWAVW